MRIPLHSVAMAAVAAVLVIPALTGCAHEGSPSLVTASQPSPAASAFAADPQPGHAVKTLSPDGYGALKLGMTKNQAATTGELRQCVSPQEDIPCSQLRDAPAGTGNVCVSDALGVAAIEAFPGLRTDRGVAVGSTLADMKAAYPAARKDQHGYYVAPATPNHAAFYSMAVDGTGHVTELTLALNDQDCFS